MARSPDQLDRLLSAEGRELLATLPAGPLDPADALRLGTRLRRTGARDHRQGQQQPGGGADRQPDQSPQRRAGAGRAVVPDLGVAEQSSHSRSLPEMA